MQRIKQCDPKAEARARCYELREAYSHWKPNKASGEQTSPRALDPELGAVPLYTVPALGKLGLPGCNL